MRFLSRLTCTVLLSVLAFAQNPEPKPAFEVADIHVSPPTRFPFLREPTLRRGRYEIKYATVVELIRIAYHVDSERVLGGPTWLENEFFDLVAQAPPETTKEGARPLLRALLEDRFSLKVHNDSKSIPAWAMKAGKRIQLKESDSTATPECKFTPPLPGANSGPPVISYSCHNMTMSAFAEALHRSIALGSQFLNDRVVADQTDLKGAWDFDFKYTVPQRMMGPGNPEATTGTPITLQEGLEKIGLKLEPADVSLPVIFVDRVNRTPTPNAPDAAAKLHIAPAPTEFEVATLKPSDPDAKGMRFQLQPGGRINIAGVPLKFLIEQAWDVTDDMIVGAPKWLDSDRYDIVAKAAIEGREPDIEEVIPMIRALIKDRFKMTAHMEDRPSNAYTLIAVKPKIKKADPVSRTKYKEGPANDGKDPRNKNPMLGRLVTCQNMTMADFAAKLKDIAPGYIHSKVLDATKLEGGYDFTLSFSPAGLNQAGAPGGRNPNEGGAKPPSPGEAIPTASDPNGAITLFEAIERQLGLKLELQKRPVPVLVIDHIEQKPSEN